jgi:cold shock protein
MPEQGTVKWFNNQKGYGFIHRESGGKDVFVYADTLLASGLLTLREGERVSFDVVTGRYGRLEAKNVVQIS